VLAAQPARLGQVWLANDVLAPAPINAFEIHRQPGGYIREIIPGDIDAALTCISSVKLCRNAKGMGTGAKAGADYIGRFVASVAQRRCPDLAPTVIFDMGCGTGD